MDKPKRKFHVSPKVYENILTYTILIIGAFVSLVPFAWMISTSFKSLHEAMGTSFFPSALQFQNYVEAWEKALFSKYFITTIKITAITLVGSVSFSTLAAYAFARIKFPGRDVIFGLLLSTMMIPAMVTIIPNFLVVTWLGRIGPIPWIDNWPALTIPFMGSVFNIFLLRQFFAQIPDELFDAARIDGSGHLRFLFTVVLPLTKAPMLVIIILGFMGSWNALAWPLLVTNTPAWRPISVGLLNFVSEAGQENNLTMTPLKFFCRLKTIISFSTQKQFTESIARSGLKG